ncbi:MAG: sulfur transferase domain-containing protein, partial [Perlucidibaca sp.]
HGLAFAYLPVRPGQVDDAQARRFAELLRELPAPVLAFCRTGNRSGQLFEHARALGLLKPDRDHAEILVLGGGAAGIGVSASLLRRRPDLDIAIVEPSDRHYYQPAWTLVGGGAFDIDDTVRETASLMPRGARWIRDAVASIDPEQRQVRLAGGRVLTYGHLIVSLGLELCWEAIEGLEETLGEHGVTSNYRFDLAPYTWALVRNLKSGTALFTQPPMPIKCAGAPQKAMYLSCDHWLRQGRLNDIHVEFNNAGAVLFGVETFVPPLMKYVERYGAKLAFQSTLVRVDGPAGKAWFDVKTADGTVSRVEKSFDMLHVVPPQRAPDVVRKSLLADAAGWCEVDQFTLRHPRFPEVFSLGDVCSSPNAKTAAAVRKQIVVVAENLLAAVDDKPLPTRYDGYGSCPLTVERGRIVLAEFGFGGKLLPTFPLDPVVPRRAAWFLKAVMLPQIYWHLMLKGREWLARPSQPGQ